MWVVNLLLGMLITAAESSPGTEHDEDLKILIRRYLAKSSRYW